jgi:hypothetical protein
MMLTGSGSKLNGLPVLRGFLDKNSPNSLIGFQRRLCVLKNREFSYYKLDKNGNAILKGALNFDQYRVELVRESKYKDYRFELKILNCDRHFVFRPPKEEVKLDHGWNCHKDWTFALQ